MKVLISGAGIGGPVLAYWLGKAGISVIVVERADRLRKEGQTVDIRDEGVTIMKWMGIEEEVRKVTTKEAGLKFVDSKNQIWAIFPQAGPSGSFTSEFEIVRGELATILYDASKEKAEYIFGDSIESMEEQETCTRVKLAKGRIIECDAVVVAEGLNSRTRAMAFKENVRDPIRPLHQIVANFSYDKGDSDEEWARWYNATKHRVLLVRPDGFGRVRAGAIYYNKSDSISMLASLQTNPEKQKEFFINLYKGAGWESEKVMEGLCNATDLYVQEVAQAKCKTWSKGRVVLLGDSAYCPSPITGMGTTATLVGSFMLASELVKHQDDPKAAFKAYESTLRPWIEGIQFIPPGFPGLACPETAWGIRVLHLITYAMSLVVKSGIIPIFEHAASYVDFGKKLKLPDPSIFQTR